MLDHTSPARKTIALAVPAVVAGLLLGLCQATVVYAAATSQASSVSASFELSGSGQITTTRELTVVDTAVERIGSGQRDLLASNGKVRNGTSRARLTRALHHAATTIVTADQEIVAQQRAATAVNSNPDVAVIYVIASPLLGNPRPRAETGLATAIHDVEAAQKATSNEVRAWEIQNTIRANQQKAMAAATAAAQPAAGSQLPTVHNSGVYTENVWASGFQAQLDACRGGVNLSAAYGVATIGEVWGCGGSRFPKAGAEVQLTGTMRGLYRVGPVVAIVNAHTGSPSDIPRGYALLYQTCLNGNASTETFTELTPIG
jgi:hypothetical protein